MSEASFSDVAAQIKRRTILLLLLLLLLIIIIMIIVKKTMSISYLTIKYHQTVSSRRKYPALFPGSVSLDHHVFLGC